jgi:C1A family cysteine protease
MGGLVLFGVPPEEYWPYRVGPPYLPDDFDEEPPAFCYAFAQGYQAITYYKYDPPGTTPDVVLSRVKTNLAAALPAMFGFVVYSSIAQAGTTGKIPFPVAGERVLGGHAIVAVGYDDTMKIKNTSPGGKETTGAFLIRNSWGTGWGDHGYGWFPYDYVTARLAVDWWSLLKNEYVETGQFGL